MKKAIGGDDLGNRFDKTLRHEVSAVETGRGRYRVCPNRRLWSPKMGLRWAAEPRCRSCGYCEGYWDGPSPKIEFVLIEPSPPLPRLALPAVPAKPSIKTLAFCSFLRSSSAHWSAV